MTKDNIFAPIKHMIKTIKDIIPVNIDEWEFIPWKNKVIGGEMKSKFFNIILYKKNIELMYIYF